MRIYLTLALTLLLSSNAFSQALPDVVESVYNASNWGVEKVDTAGSYTGENIDMSSLELSWSTTDLAIPGNIPIRVGRTYTNFDSPFSAWTPNVIDARWDLDIPSIKFGTWANLAGRMNACMSGANLGRIKNYNISVPGAGKFREIGRNPSIQYPANTIAQFENNWLMLCESFTTRSNSKNVNGNAHGPSRPWGVTLMSPDGLKYRFAFYSSWQPFTWDPQYLLSIGLRRPILRNYELRVTDIEDQFGNYLAFDYEEISLNTNYKLLRPKAIRSNDGRKVDFFYRSGGNNNLYQSNQLSRIKYGNYEVTYGYNGSNKLNRVTLPEGLRWDFNYRSASAEAGRELSRVDTPSGARIDYGYTDITDAFACDAIKTLNTNVSQRTVTSGSQVYNYTYSVTATTPNFSTTTRTEGPQVVEELTTVCIPSQRDDLPLQNYISQQKIGHLNTGGSFIIQRQTDYQWNSIQHGTAMDLGDWNDRTPHREYIRKTTVDSNYTSESLSLNGYGSPQTIREAGPNISRDRNIGYWNSPSKWLVSYLATETIGNDHRAVNTYDSNGRQRTATVNGVKTTYTYSGANLASATDGVSNTTRYQNYYLGSPRLVLLPQGRITLAYDTFGRTTSRINERNNTTGYTWDRLGRLKTINHPIGHDVSVVYTGNSRITVTRGPQQEIIYLDGLNRTWRIDVRDTSGSTTRTSRFSYDDRGNQTFASLPAFNASEGRGVRSSYDALNRLTRQVSPIGTSTLAYPTTTRSVITKPNGFKVTRDFRAFADPSNAALMSIAEEHATNDSVTTSIQRDSVNRPTRVLQGGLDIDYRYHSTYKDFVNQIDYPSHIERLEPDANGRVSAKHYGNNQRIQYTYDFRGNVKTINYPDSTPDETFGYSLTGQLTSASNGVSAWEYRHDRLENLIYESLNLDEKDYTIAYRYNLASDLIETTFPSGKKVEYTPNIFGETRAIENIVNNVGYFADGDIQSVAHANGVNTSFTRQSNGVNLGSMVGKRGSATRFSYTYTYDAQRNLRSITDGITTSNSVSNITYDGMDRIRSATSSSFGGTLSYTYDDLSNLRTRKLGNSTWTYRYNGSTNQLTRVDGTNRQFTYDNRANVTNNGQRIFSYNIANRLSSSSDKQYVYDANGRRIKAGDDVTVYSQTGQLIHRSNRKAATDYIYLGNRLVAKNEFSLKSKVIIIPFDDLVIAVRNPNASADPSSAKTTFVHSDILGSPIADTNTSGNVTARYNYEPYGKAINGTGSDIGYAGHKFDTDLGLSYMQTRYYDPLIGRFYGNDQIGFTESNPSFTFNRYAYVNNNPYKFVDPDGRAAVSAEGNIQIPGFLAKGINRFFGDKNSVPISGVHFGLAASFPTFLDPSAEFDLGVFGGIDVSILDLGLGKASADIGISSGDLGDLKGGNIEASATVGRINGGLTFSEDGTFTGIKAGRGVTPGGVLKTIANVVEKLPEGNLKSLGKGLIKNNVSIVFKETKVKSLRDVFGDRKENE